MGKFNKGGYLGGFDQLRAPNAPTLGTITAGDEQLSVVLTAPSYSTGTISYYCATAIAGGVSIGAENTSSPVTITGLTNDTQYTVSGVVKSEYGASPSSSTNTATPIGPFGYLSGGVSDLGLFTSGYNVNILDFVTISSTGNAADFGDATAVLYNGPGHGNATRGITAYGGAGQVGVIDYVDFATKGDAADFGDVATDTAGTQRGGGCGSNARGVFSTMFPSSDSTIIEYVTMASLGNGADFGDLSLARSRGTATSSATRGVFAGGEPFGLDFTDTIDYITISSTGNASDFGNLTDSGRTFASACASATRGVFLGGYKNNAGNYVDTIDYITIGSTGNASDFGDLTAARASTAGTSNATRGIVGGGDEGSAVNTIEYITIGSTGNAQDFGDLTAAKRWHDAVGSATAAGAA